jgi:CheY-like chemotaxis protein
VIFSSGELGSDALEAYNRFATTPATSSIPAILLLGENQSGWRAEATADQRHVVVSMPVKLGEFRELMSRLLPPKNEEVTAG